MTNTTTFLTAVKDSIKDFTLTKATYMAVGTGTTTETTSDTSLETENTRKARQESATGLNDVTVSLFIGSTEANGADLTEVGAFDESGTGSMMSRIVFPELTKTSAIELWIDIEEQIDVTQ